MIDLSKICAKLHDKKRKFSGKVAARGLKDLRYAKAKKYKLKKAFKHMEFGDAEPAFLQKTYIYRKGQIFENENEVNHLQPEFSNSIECEEQIFENGNEAHQQHAHPDHLQNGSLSGSLMIQKVPMNFINTCAFDALFEIISSAYSNFASVRAFMDQHINANEFCDAVINFESSSSFDNLYLERAFMLQPHSRILRENVFDCQINIANLAEKLLPQPPSTLIKKMNKCLVCARETKKSEFAWLRSVRAFANRLVTSQHFTRRTKLQARTPLLHGHDTTNHRCAHSFQMNYSTSADTPLLREQLTSTAATQLLHKVPPNDVQGQTLPLSTAFYSFSHVCTLSRSNCESLISRKNKTSAVSRWHYDYRPAKCFLPKCAKSCAARARLAKDYRISS
ncbi:unnamed protein product [Trichogramma brassicae]|uniref:Uncharacterized protein n=1 Tax=Trichogramma brassicae TaxID=86971 RepID=A0A6H5IX79_9HYME|nr:unnamed protein product [Trichogramma brassicae]